MNNNSNWFSSLREKVVKPWICTEMSSYKNRSHNSQDRLPPRLSTRGLSIAARVVGHRIRDLTKNKTGKDLACLRNNETRKKILSQLSHLRLAIANHDTKYDLMCLAANHSSNFTSSLSPEGDANVNSSCEFKKHASLHKFISNYHKKCLNENNAPKESAKIRQPSLKQKYERSRKVCKNTEKVLDEKSSLECRCGNVEKISGNNDNYYNNSFNACWLHRGIKEEKLDKYYDENRPHFDASASEKFKLNVDGDWSEFVQNKNCTAFRRKLKNGLYEYRVQASFYNVTANHLFKTQMNTEYRKQWDPYVLKLDVMDSNSETSSELIHWVTKCPYPFSTREYIYLRRFKVDEKRKAIILYQSSTAENNIKKNSEVERVDVYESKMIIKPHHHGDFNQNGCDFLLTYYDDLKMKFVPSSLVDMAASKGICDSADRMYSAAQDLGGSSW